MKKTLLILGMLIGLASIFWGANLIHDSYTLGKDSTFMLKSGITEITKETTKFHSVQSSKELVVHLGLVIVGVSIVTFSITRKFST